ncbi:MAG: subtype A tannase [Eubacteriales bacterium]|nr:subtype A tannase [Eubacteriales bacterium]
MKNRMFKILAIGLTGSMLIGCTAGASEVTETDVSEMVVSTTSEVETALDQIDNTKWQYNEEDDVYYQIGISYCENPADEKYETLSIFVPGAYMSAEDNGDGTYTCKINSSATIGNYTAETAPIVLPVNTPGYSAQSALTEYQSFTEYTNEGIIYVHAGCRGRDSGAPSGVTDLKAAIRYIRYNTGNIAGDTEKIFSFGMSGGGAQSALLGVTGDSELYDDYLEEIGAVMGVSDAVYGSMAWCPITSLDTADAAYEWNMGSTRTDLTEEEQTISDELTEAYAEYINALGLTDSDGNALTLEQSEDGNWQAGTYYDYVKSAIEDSLNQFLADTTFPYDTDSASQGHQAGMGPKGDFKGQMPDGEFPDGEMAKDGSSKEMRHGFGKTSGDSADSSIDETNENVDFTQIDDISRTQSSGGVSISGTYESAQDYIDALNANGEWVSYDAETNTAAITSVADFAKAMKNASKGLGAFDQLDESQGENQLFGTNGETAHFDSTLAEILAEMGSEYADDYAEDLEATDALGHTVQERINMYSPLYYLMESSEGYGTSTVAQYFRIRTGISQGDTSVTTELNLAQALENEGTEVDFAAVWGQEHTMAETSGDSTENFIAWIHECMGN